MVLNLTHPKSLLILPERRCIKHNDFNHQDDGRNKPRETNNDRKGKQDQIAFLEVN
jgi:hypothetical protein